MKTLPELVRRCIKAQESKKKEHRFTVRPSGKDKNIVLYDVTPVFVNVPTEADTDTLNLFLNTGDIVVDVRLVVPETQHTSDDLVCWKIRLGHVGYLSSFLFDGVTLVRCDREEVSVPMCTQYFAVIGTVSYRRKKLANISLGHLKQLIHTQFEQRSGQDVT